MRALIERRLAEQAALPADSNTPLLANVVGDVSDELRAILHAPSHDAAVLLGLEERANGLHVLLTERAEHLAHHAGQVSLPGGRIEPHDDGPVQAALREAWEEVGLRPESVEIAGCLAPHATGTGFRVTPVVGFIGAGFEPVPDANEVSAVFEVPLEFMLDRGNATVTYRERYGSRFRMYEFRYGGYRIWGATAGILVSFMRLINEEYSIDNDRYQEIT